MTTKPSPRVTPDNRPFWEGCRERVLRLPWCAACERAFLPPAPVCPTCFGERLEWRAASGRGTVHSWTVSHQAFHPAFGDRLPIVLATVDLEEGVRMNCRLDGVAPGEIEIGLPVEVGFEDVGGGVTLPYFRPRAAP